VPALRVALDRGNEPGQVADRQLFSAARAAHDRNVALVCEVDDNVSRQVGLDTGDDEHIGVRATGSRGFAGDDP